MMTDLIETLQLLKNKEENKLSKIKWKRLKEKGNNNWVKSLELINMKET